MDYFLCSGTIHENVKSIFFSLFCHWPLLSFAFREGRLMVMSIGIRSVHSCDGYNLVFVWLFSCWSIRMFRGVHVVTESKINGTTNLHGYVIY